MAVDITLYRPTVYNAAKDRTSVYREGTCLSTDEKPADWDGGSALLETDTGKVFVYDEENGQWREQ